MAEFNTNTPQDANSSFGHYLVLAGIEALLNSLISLDPLTVQALTRHNGLVIKIKIRQPYLVFYLIVDSEGLEVRSEYPGHSDIRMSSDLMTFLRIGFGMHIEPDQLKIWGDAQKISELTGILQSFDLRTAVSGWLRQRVQLSDILERIRNQDSSWLKELTPVPGLMRDTMLQLKQMNQRLEQQERLFKEQQNRQRRQRLLDFMLIVATGGMIVLSMHSTASWKESLLPIVFFSGIVAARFMIN